MKKFFLFFSLLLCLLSQGQFKFNLINSDTTVFNISYRPLLKFQLDVTKISGTVQGKVFIQLKSPRGFDNIRTENLLNVNKQVFLIQEFFDRIVIITEGTLRVNIGYHVLSR